MALRLTADAHLQFCLLREDTAINIRECLENDDDYELRKAIDSALKVFREAEFVENKASVGIRLPRKHIMDP